MFRLVLKNLAANKIRLGLTALAIVLGVGFVVSSFVLRDGLKDSFSSLAAEIVGDTDMSVESNDDAFPLDESDLEVIRSTPGVRVAEGGVGADAGLVQPIKADGTTISNSGPPQLAFTWVEEPQLNPSTIAEGRAPQGPGEWVIDTTAADRHDFVIGDTYEIITPSGKQSAELVGTFRFGASNTTNGATLMAFELETARDYFLLDDIYHSISIGVDGSVPVPEIQASLEAALDNPNYTGEGSRALVQDQSDLQSDIQGDFNQFIDIFGGILLGFALVSLFVSIFIIANTFAIVTGQRIRELGLLRAIGATPSQIRRSVLIESFMIGLIASLIGIAAGVGIAYGMRGLLNLLSFQLPSFGVVLSPTTIIFALAVGIIVTVISALFPAYAAARVTPIAAISGVTSERDKSAARYVIGAIVSAAGAGLIALGLFGSGDSVISVLAPLGAGAAILFVGLTLLSPPVAAPLSRFLGSPLQPIFHEPGQLAKENAARNPRRTATTAAALMIGLSLVSLAMVLGDSFKAEFDKILNTTIQADYLVTSDGAEANVPFEVVELLKADPAFDQVSPLYYWDADFTNDRVDGSTDPYNVDVIALDYSVADGLFEFGVLEGSIAEIDDDSAGIRDSVAEDLGIGLGDSLGMVLADGSTAELEVVAIFEEEQVVTPVMITHNRFTQISDQTTVDWIAARRSETASVEQADAQFASYEASYPSVAFDSAASFRENAADQIDQALNILTVLLGLAVFIALIGIANTLALSVFERTREIGLLRAVGMTRRQTRRMIRWEAAIISAVGAVLGAIIGVGFGVVMVQAIPDDIISSFAIPWGRIAFMVAIAGFAGLIAAFAPAFRASRMDVLEAISHV